MHWIEQISRLNLSKNKYSQTGEEIILQFIFDNIGTTDNYLVDFGAGDGKTLSNSALLIENGWKGLRMDADNRGNKDVAIEFITPENIEHLFRKHKVPYSFDLLSIDMDSCDFQILEKILPQYTPRVICAEYNPAFEPHESKYLEYKKLYTWDGTTKYGFSLLAGKKLMEKFDYSLIYNQKFLNLFFVHNSIIGKQEIEVPNKKQLFHPQSKDAVWVTY